MEKGASEEETLVTIQRARSRHWSHFNQVHRKWCPGSGTSHTEPQFTASMPEQKLCAGADHVCPTVDENTNKNISHRPHIRHLLHPHNNLRRRSSPALPHPPSAAWYPHPKCCWGSEDVGGQYSWAVAMGWRGAPLPQAPLTSSPTVGFVSTCIFKLLSQPLSYTIIPLLPFHSSNMPPLPTHLWGTTGTCGGA